MSSSRHVFLSVADLKNKIDWKRSEGAAMAAGCSLDLHGNSGVAGLDRRFILSGEAEEAHGEAWCHVRGREGKRAGPTLDPEACVGAEVAPDWDSKDAGLWVRLLLRLGEDEEEGKSQRNV